MCFVKGLVRFNGRWLLYYGMGDSESGWRPRDCNFPQLAVFAHGRGVVPAPVGGTCHVLEPLAPGLAHVLRRRGVSRSVLYPLHAHRRRAAEALRHPGRLLGFLVTFYTLPVVTFYLGGLGVGWVLGRALSGVSSRPRRALRAFLPVPGSEGRLVPCARSAFPSRPSCCHPQHFRRCSSGAHPEPNSPHPLRRPALVRPQVVDPRVRHREAAGPRWSRRRWAIQPGQECPPGMTEWRADNCRAPEFPPPSIVDYRPRSTVVATAHPVPKAKDGAVDYHAHVAGMLTSQESLAAFMKQLDSIGVQLAVSADNLSGERLRQAVDVVRNSPYKDRVRILTGISFQGVGPGWAEKAVAQLEADIKAGAVGVGEIGKGLGLSTRKADGTRLKLDDSDLDPCGLPPLA